MAQDNNNPFSDLGAVPVEQGTLSLDQNANPGQVAPSQAQVEQANPFADLGAIPVQAPSDLQNYQAQQSASAALQQGINEFNPAKAQVVPALQHGLSTTIRAIDRIGERFLPQEVRDAGVKVDLKDNPLLSFIVPPKGYEPKGTVENLLSIAGSFADPAQYIVNKAVAGPAAQAAIEALDLGKAVTRAESAFLSRGTNQTVDLFYKASRAEKAARLGIEGGIQGLYAGSAEALSEKDPVAAAEKIAASTALGTVGGLALGALQAKIQKPEKLDIERFKVRTTPLNAELESNLEKQLLEQAKINQDLEILQQFKPQQNLKQRYQNVNRAEAESIDAASQAAAEVEFQTEQQANAKLHKATEKELQVPFTIDSTEKQVAQAQEKLGERINESSSKWSQKSAEIDQEIATLRQELETSKLSGEPIESRFSSQQAIEQKIQGLEAKKTQIIESANNEINLHQANFQDSLDQVESKLDAQIEKLGKARDNLLLNAAGVEESGNQRLQRLSDVAEQRSNAAQFKRESILSQAQDLKARTSEKYHLLQEKLQKNLEQIILLQDHANQMGFTAVKANKTLPQMLDIAQQQVDKVDQALAKGLIPERHAAALRKLEWDNAMQLQGAKINPELPVDSLGRWLNRTQQFGRLDRKLGTKTADVVLESGMAHHEYRNFLADTWSQVAEPAKKLQAMGYSMEEQGRILQYIESNEAGLPFFDPSPVQSKSLSRPAYQGPQISQEALAEFGKMRTAFDSLQTSTGANKVRGYVPLRAMDARAQALGAGGKAVNITDPTFAENRLSGELVPGYHEQNIIKLWDRYTREVGRHLYYTPILEKGVGEYNKLMLAGQEPAAAEFRTYLARVLGLKTEKEAASLLGSQAYAANRDVIFQAGSKAADPETFLSQLGQEIKKLTYQSLVSLNPKALLKQAFQPELMGGAEIGSSNMAKARTLQFTKEYREPATRLLRRSMSEQLPEMADEILRPGTQARNPLIKGLRLVTGAGEVLSKPYAALEKQNRMVSLVGSLYQATNALEKDGAVGLLNLTKNMTPAEQSLVRKALDQQGEQAAKEMYALLRTRRINFVYDITDRPEILNGEYARNIPFTGFARGIVTRMIEDVGSKNFGTLAKRIAIPIVANQILESTTGYKVSGLNPYNVGTVVQPISGSIMPGVVDAGKELATTGDFTQAGKQLLKVTPVGAYENMQRSIKRAGNDAANIVGAEKVGTRRPLVKGVKEDLLGVRPK